MPREKQILLRTWTNLSLLSPSTTYSPVSFSGVRTLDSLPLQPLATTLADRISLAATRPAVVKVAGAGESGPSEYNLDNDRN